MTSDTDTGLVDVEQCDRDAAAAHWFRTVEATDANFAVGHHLRIGKADHNDLIQAFARHRLAALSRPNADFAAVVEQCARVCDEYRVEIFRGHWEQPRLANTLAAAIRSLQAPDEGGG